MKNQEKSRLGVSRRACPGTRMESRKAAALASRTLLKKRREDDRDAIVRAVITAAKGGDPTAMRFCIERLVPLRKGRPTVFDLPPVKTAADIAGAIGELARAMAAGELTTDEASAAASVIEMHRRAIETTEIEVRLQKLEER